MPPQMSSEKFIRAERRNRLETHRLKVTYRHYDKETVRLNYEIDREKRSITKAFRNVIKTSGASDLGIPPESENDTDFEKCPSYMQGLKLSNKRLMEWRECEKQLEKFITQHELERAKQKRKKYLKKKTTDYDVIPAKKYDDLEDDVFVDNESVISNEVHSPTDILKENPNDSSEVFDIKKWEADIVESYKTMVCKKPNVNSSDTNAKHKLKSSSSPTFSTHSSEYDTDKKKRVRPHTAQPRTRPVSGRSSIPQRPASAAVHTSESQSPFLITKDSIYIKTGQSFEKLLDNRPVGTPVMVNNYINTSTLRPPTTSVEKEPSIASISTLCPVQEGDEDDETDDANIATEVAKDAKDTEDTFAEDKNVKGDNSKGNEIKSQLSLKFQRRLRQKLERTRSASSGMTGLQGHRNNFKHSNSDLSSYVEGSRRTRRDSSSASSMISMPMSRTGSFVSSHRPSVSLGIPADIEEIQRGHDKLLSEIKPDKPLATNKLVSVSKIVRAALTFSRVARKRALLKMQNENSSDAHEVVRQERIRKLQSRQNVLNTIASQWNTDPCTTIEQVE